MKANAIDTMRLEDARVATGTRAAMLGGRRREAMGLISENARGAREQPGHPLIRRQATRLDALRKTPNSRRR